MGNSGVSIRFFTGQVCHHDPARLQAPRPSKIGYEIQINNQYPDPHPTGSIYGFMDAKTGVQKDNDWNTLDIESRKDMIRETKTTCWWPTSGRSAAPENRADRASASRPVCGDSVSRGPDSRIESAIARKCPRCKTAL